MKSQKTVIYQILVRLLGNKLSNNIPNGTIEENGCGKFEDISVRLLSQLRENGYTHLWLTGVLAHSSTTDYTRYGIPREFPEIIKGKAGSFYAVRDYYDVDPDLAVSVENRMGEFEELVKRIHQSGLKLIIDFVPNHLSRTYRSVAKPRGVKDFGADDDVGVAFSPDNNFYYLPGEELDILFTDKREGEATYREFPARVTGNDAFTSQPSQYDWYETVKLNYGVDVLNSRSYFEKIPDTWHKMREVLLFWAKKRVDGFRCDMAEMVPVEFWRWAIPQVKRRYPRMIFVAEIYNPAAYRSFLKDNIFDYLYDKVGVYDTLRDVACGYRPASDISFALNGVGDIQRNMLNFLENHDEQRLASDYFLRSGERGRAAMIVTACLNVNPVMVYFGQELGERGMDAEGFSDKNGRTTIFDYWSIDTIRRWNNGGKWNTALLTREEKSLKRFYSKLLNLCNDEKALREGLFYDLMPANYENRLFDSARQFAFMRGGRGEVVLVLANFGEREVEIAVEIPRHALDFFAMNDSGKFRATPLFPGGDKEVEFSPPKLFETKLGACSGEIYKISGF